MDAPHAALVLIVVVLVLLLVLRGRRPGKTSTKTFHISIGQTPNREGSDRVALDTRVREGEVSSSTVSDVFSTQLQERGLPGTIAGKLPAREGLGQKIFEQLLLPKELLRDVEVQKLFSQGFASLQQGNYEQATAVFRKAVNLAHHNLFQPQAKPEIEAKIAGIAHSNLAGCLLAAGDVDAAIIEFREGLRLAPELAGLHEGLGNALSTKGEQDAAASEFREAARLDPNLAAMHNSFGQELAAKGDLDGAAREYRRALNLNAQLPGVEENLRAAVEKKDPNPP